MGIGDVLQKLRSTKAKCKKCGFTTISSEEETAHTIKHTIEELNCHPKTKHILELINREFTFNIDDAEEIFNDILDVMEEPEKIKIVNPFEIIRSKSDD